MRRHSILLAALLAALSLPASLRAQRVLDCGPRGAVIEVGSTLRLASEARDPRGYRVPRAAVRWGSLDTAIVRVAGDSIARGMREGAALLWCFWGPEPLLDTLTVVVRAPAPEAPAPPQPDPGTREPDLEETFAYENTAQLLASPLYARSEDINTGRITLDTSVRYDGQPTMRYDYPARPGRTEYTISRTIDLRPAGSVREVWIEAAVRFDPHFTLDGGVQNYGQALKLLHVGVIGSGVDSRFGLNFENGDGGEINGEGPNDRGDYHKFYIRGSGAARARNLFDGSWHVVRYHIRLNGNGTATHEFWVDGQYQGQKTARTNGTRLWAIALARNLNQGPPRAQSMWWGRVRVWYSDPGWGR